jgi:hypothetical protein
LEYPKQTTLQLNVNILDAVDDDVKKFQEEKEVHLCMAQQFYTELHTSTQMAKDTTNIALDFEQKFTLPHIPTGEI